jgi:hypothetical protein
MTKRVREEAVAVAFDHFSDPLSEWLWLPHWTEITALLNYHATCSRLWHHYTELSFVTLLDRWRAKLQYYSAHMPDKNTLNYAPRHQLCVLKVMLDVTQINHYLCDSMRDIHTKLLAEDDKWDSYSPFSTHYRLWTVELLQRAVNIPSHIIACSPRLLEALQISANWLKLRYGWVLCYHTRQNNQYPSIATFDKTKHRLSTDTVLFVK